MLLLRYSKRNENRLLKKPKELLKQRYTQKKHENSHTFEYAYCKYVHQRCKQVMGPGQNFLTLVGSVIFGLGLVLENFP